jgi:hypothetical protein
MSMEEMMGERGGDGDQAQPQRKKNKLRRGLGKILGQ